MSRCQILIPYRDLRSRKRHKKELLEISYTSVHFAFLVLINVPLIWFMWAAHYSSYPSNSVRKIWIKFRYRCQKANCTCCTFLTVHIILPKRHKWSFWTFCVCFSQRSKRHKRYRFSLTKREHFGVSENIAYSFTNIQCCMLYH